MPKKIRLYGSIYQYSAEYFMQQMDEVQEESDVDPIIDANCSGGSPDYGMSVIQRAQQANAFLEVGAQAHSMGLFMMAYLPKERVTCIDTTQAVLHRASYGEYMESRSDFRGSVYETIMNNTNKDLEKAFRARVDVEALEALPAMKKNNITLNDIFATDKRLEVVLTAKDLKKLGLVSRIIKITPEKQAEMEANFKAFSKASSVEGFRLAAEVADKSEKPVIEKSQPQINKIMTLAELKAAHPELAAQIKNEGTAEGIAAEKARIEAWNQFLDIDAVAVKAGIDSGKTIGMNEMAAFVKKGMNREHLDKLNADAAPVAGAGETPTIDTTKTAAQLADEKRIAGIEALLDAGLGLAKK